MKKTTIKAGWDVVQAFNLRAKELTVQKQIKMDQDKTLRYLLDFEAKSSQNSPKAKKEEEKRW